MNVVHKVTGYCKADDERVTQSLVAPALLDMAKDLARVREDDPDAVFPYPLRPAVAHILADAMGCGSTRAATNISWRASPPRTHRCPDGWIAPRKSITLPSNHGRVTDDALWAAV